MTDQFRADIVALVPRLRRFAAALCGNIDEGDDIVQTACLKALSRSDQFEPGTRLDSWMFRIVQNTFLDQARRYETRMTRSDPDRLGTLTDQGGHAKQAEDRLLLDRVRQAIADLPEEQRIVLALVAIEGMSYRQASETLGLPVGTVMSRLARARERIRPLSREALS